MSIWMLVLWSICSRLICVQQCSALLSDLNTMVGCFFCPTLELLLPTSLVTQLVALASSFTLYQFYSSFSCTITKLAWQALCTVASTSHSGKHAQLKTMLVVSELQHPEALLLLNYLLSTQCHLACIQLRAAAAHIQYRKHNRYQLVASSFY